MHLVAHGKILSPDRTWLAQSVLCDQGRVVAVGAFDDLAPQSDSITDAEGALVVPGLCDVQLNGAWGFDFTQDPAAIWEVARRLPQWGVTSFLPTIITSPFETIQRACAVLEDGPPAGWLGARPLGLHLEGPFLSPKRRGAHPPQYLQLPKLEVVRAWHAPTVRLVTLAPELPHAAELIDILVSNGVTVSAGHSLASYDQARTSFKQGVRGLTHVFNAMTDLHHREPGLAVAACDDPQVIVGLIPDGLHVHPAWIRLLWRLLGPDRICLVTDAMAAVGMPPGSYALGDSLVSVDESSARLADGRLAGSILQPLTALQNLRAWTGCSLAEAWTAFSLTPARLLGCDHEYGAIKPGALADLLLLEPNGTLQRTFIGGVEVWNAHSEFVC